MPSYEKYEDRALMFSCLIKKNGKGQIHFHNKPTTNSINFNYSSPSKNTLICKWLTTLRVSYKWIKNNNYSIIHDLFMPRGIFIFKSKKILSLYSDTANYYFGKQYTKDLKNKTLLNKCSTHLLYLKRALYEYIGIKKADGIIVNSPEIADGILKYYKIKNNKKIAVINTCVDTNFWKIIDTGRDKNVIFFAGRLCKRKGLDILLKSFKTLMSKNADLKLVIAGKETTEEDFSWGRNYIKAHSLNVQFLGEINREEMRYWYNKSSVFVLPSSQEGSPRVVKEAMACGCSVVCTELPGTKILDPEASFLIFSPANNVIELTRKIEYALYGVQDQSESLREFAIKNFSPEVIADKNLKFYNELFNSNR